MKNYDVVIVGAGIVGLTAAHAVKARRPTARVAVIEKEPRPGVHASGRNSGILHSGVYYAGDTMKARFCSQGAARMRAFAAEHGIRCETWGKIIVAADEKDVPGLDRLMKNARDSGIRAERLDEKGIKALEPHANAAFGGIHCPDTAVIHSLGVVERLKALLTDRGVEFIFEEKILGPAADRKSLIGRRDTYGHGYLFNCAGAGADVLAKTYGLARDYTLLPFKGTYHDLAPAKDHLVRASVYPVPDLLLPFLGVHFTRGIDGHVHVGPTAIPALGRENYGLLDGLSPSQTPAILWRLAAMYAADNQNFRRLVHEEVRKYSGGRFHAAARRLVPAVEKGDLLASAKVGIRPQLVDVKNNRLVMDFVVEEAPGSLHVLNAISPAFTCAFAFADLLVERYEKAVP